MNNLAHKLFPLLNIKTSLAHPQLNTQVEVFNKTFKKYLASFMNDMTLTWQNLLSVLMLSYITPYHLKLQTTPFEELFGIKITIFPNTDIERLL
jgi:hypothetical protein